MDKNPEPGTNPRNLVSLGIPSWIIPPSTDFPTLMQRKLGGTTSKSGFHLVNPQSSKTTLQMISPSVKVVRQNLK